MPRKTPFQLKQHATLTASFGMKLKGLVSEVTKEMEKEWGSQVIKGKEMGDRLCYNARNVLLFKFGKISKSPGRTTRS